MSMTVKSNVGGVLAVFSLTLAVLGFATDRWLIFSVDQDKLSTNKPANLSEAVVYGVTVGRNRGLLKECYDVPPKFLENIGSRRHSNSCEWINLEIPSTKSYSSKSADYKVRIHLVRATTISAGVAMLLLFVAFLVHITSGCCDIQRRATLICGIICNFSFLALVGSFSCFLIAFFEFEQSRVKDNWHFWAYWPKELKDATKYSLGWSLWVFLASIVMNLAAVFLFFAAYSSSSSKDEGKEPFHDLDGQSYPMDYSSAHPRGVHETRDRDERSVVSSASGPGRVMKNQLGKRTIDPVTGREVSARMNEGFDDGSSLPDSQYNSRQDRRGPNTRRNDNRSEANGHNYYPERSYYRTNDRSVNRDQYEQRYDERVPRSDSSRYPPEPHRDYDSPRRDSRQRDYRRYESGRDQYFE